MSEIEVKILEIDIPEIINILDGMGLERVKDETQINTIYDFPDLPLLSKKGYARIREVCDRSTGISKSYMTVKTMISQEKFKEMDESETEIADAEAGHGIFKSLGLIVRKILIKDRISYRYKNTLIEIDNVPEPEYPFPLLEVETHNEKELEEVVKFLGYTMNDITSKTMTEIVSDREKSLNKEIK